MKAGHRAGFDPGSLALVHAELERVLRCLGPARDQVTVIGGLVPSLLVPEPGREPHAGTTDVDLCLTIALAEGATGRNGTSPGDAATRLRAAGYRPSTARGKDFRWRGRAGVVVDFLYPASGRESPLATVRSPLEWDPPAMAALGHEFAAMAVGHGELLDATRRRVRFRPVLDGIPVPRAWVHVAGPCGLLALKVDALRAAARRAPKDAYDVIWLLDALDPGAAARAAARQIRSRRAALADLHGVLDQADELFGPGGPAAAAYARFVAAPGEAPSPTDERFATETLREFTATLRPLLRARRP